MKVIDKEDLYNIENNPPKIKYNHRKVLCYCLVTPSPRHNSENTYKAFRTGWIPIGDDRIFVNESKIEKERYYDVEVLRWIQLNK